MLASFGGSQIRKCYIQLLAGVVKHLGELPSKMFHGDLRPLLRDDPESDFFVNVTHIQLHRRMRALGRLKRILLHKRESDGEDQDEIEHDQDPSLKLSQGTFSQVLVPR